MNRSILLCLLLSLFTVGCSKKEKTPDTQLPIPKTIRKFPTRDKFTYSKRQTFALDVDSLGLAKYRLLDSTTFINLFNGTNLERYNSQFPSNNYLYSYQDSTNLVKAITIVMVEDSYYFYLKYLTFTSGNELIDSLDIAGFGGDGGSGFHAYGHFANDSIYERTWTNSNSYEDSLSGHWIQEKDSSITRYLIHRNGTIDELISVDK